MILTENHHQQWSETVGRKQQNHQQQGMQQP
jgi:hypothetical protein